MRPVSFRHRRPGFSLIEVVLALGVVAVAVLALIGLMGTTFTSARQVALQHKAINAITVLDGALQNPKSIDGLSLDAAATNAFDQLFTSTLKDLDLSKAKNFLIFNKSPKGVAGKGGVSAIYTPAVVALSGDSLPPLSQVQSEAFQADTNKTSFAGADTSAMFLMRVKLSPLLVGKIYKLNSATFEPTSDTYQTGSIGSKPDDYALAYVPLVVEVYPVDLTDSTDPFKNTDIKPVLTQTVVVNR